MEIKEIDQLYNFNPRYSSRIMKSSFKKIEKNSTASQKAYFGHPDLDAVFYNSLTKGHMMILEEDHPTTNYLSLLRYYVGSNYHKKIPTIIYDTTPQKWKHLISPIKKAHGNVEEKPQQKSEIAWRYDKMEINLNQLILNEEIKFLDLTKEIEKIEENLVLGFEFPAGSLADFYHKIEQDFMNCQEDEKDTRAKKILISTLPSYFYNHPNLHTFLHALRCLTRSSHVTTLITLPPIISEEVRNKFLLYTDYYLQIGKVGHGYKDFNSSLRIVKEVQCGQIQSRFRGVSLWGIKNKKKELRIESLYEQAVEEDPEEDKAKVKESGIQF